MELDNLIFDRTQADVNRVKTLTQKLIAGTATDAEKSEWLAGMKGAYNASDLNRVGSAVEYLNDYFLSLGYHTGYQPITVPHQSTSPLPDGYTQLEYIQSSGTQYIDTLFKPDQDTRVAVDFETTSSSTDSMALFGARNATNVAAFTVWLSAGNQIGAQYGANAWDAYAITATFYGQIFTYDLNKNVFSVGTQTRTLASAVFSTNSNLTVFAINTNNSVDNRRVSGKLYSCKIYDNGTLIRDFVPCKNLLNAIGLYDTVNGQFYANAGSGTFVAGPEVENAPKDPTLWYEDDIPTQTLMEQYIANVEALRSILPLPSGTPQTPDDMEALTYQEANNIEEILYTLEQVLLAMQENFLLRQANTLFMIAGGVFNNAG